MFKNIKYQQNIIFYFPLAAFAFIINHFIGSSGVFPIDTFIHYDNGYRILLGEHPVKDYWIVHGFLIDYIQAFFFKVLGNSWNSYIFHSSIFNSIIVLLTFYIFNLLKLRIEISFLLSLLTGILAYPVSGTPFIDLHSTYFSLFSVFFGIIAIIKNKNHFWILSSILLCLAFFSKQVPAAYTIIGISLINLYISIKKKDFRIFLFFLSGSIIFILLLYLFLFFIKIPLYDFILQIFLFPQSIGQGRYDTYSLNFKNIFLDYKFIYFPFLILSILNIKELLKKKYAKSNNFFIYLLLAVLVVTSIFHQIYTNNQVYIFSLIPICSGFAIYYNNQFKINFKNKINLAIIILCLFSTYKYHERFNIDRKFHELKFTKISNAIDAKAIDLKLDGLKWISPYFKNPKKEIEIINNFIAILRNDNEKKMIITQYNFISSILEKKLYSPSRTYDAISFPKKKSKYFENYKLHLVNLVKKNKIEKIYIFEPNSKINLNDVIFNYIPKNCFTYKQLNKHLISLKVKSCESLR